MTVPITEVNTVPYCGACGWVPFNFNHGRTDLYQDLVCDACGADLLAYGWTAGLIPPVLTSVVGDTPLAGDVSVTFVANVSADTTDLRYGVNVEPNTIITGVTSVYVLLQATSGAVSTDKVAIQIRSVHLGVAGPWSVTESVTIA